MIKIRFCRLKIKRGHFQICFGGGVNGHTNSLIRDSSADSTTFIVTGIIHVGTRFRRWCMYKFA